MSFRMRRSPVGGVSFLQPAKIHADVVVRSVARLTRADIAHLGVLAPTAHDRGIPLLPAWIYRGGGSEAMNAMRSARFFASGTVRSISVPGTKSVGDFMKAFSLAVVQVSDFLANSASL